MFTLNYSRGTKRGQMHFYSETDAINTAWEMYVEKFADVVVVMDINGNVVYRKA